MYHIVHITSCLKMHHLWPVEGAGLTSYTSKKWVGHCRISPKAYGTGALSRGCVWCRVVAWEPVPQFRLFLEYGLQLNRFLGAVEVRRSAVADLDGALYTLQVPRVWAKMSLTWFTSFMRIPGVPWS